MTVPKQPAVVAYRDSIRLGLPTVASFVVGAVALLIFSIDTWYPALAVIIAWLFSSFAVGLFTLPAQDDDTGYAVPRSFHFSVLMFSVAITAPFATMLLAIGLGEIFAGLLVVGVGNIFLFAAVIAAYLMRKRQPWVLGAGPGRIDESGGTVEQAKSKARYFVIACCVGFVLEFVANAFSAMWGLGALFVFFLLVALPFATPPYVWTSEAAEYGKRMSRRYILVPILGMFIVPTVAGFIRPAVVSRVQASQMSRLEVGQIQSAVVGFLGTSIDGRGTPIFVDGGTAIEVIERRSDGIVVEVPAGPVPQLDPPHLLVAHDDLKFALLGPTGLTMTPAE